MRTEPVYDAATKLRHCKECFKEVATLQTQSTTTWEKGLSIHELTHNAPNGPKIHRMSIRSVALYILSVKPQWAGQQAVTCPFCSQPNKSSGALYHLVAT